MAENKNSGGMWRKMSQDGKTPYFSCNIELDGVKTYFKAFKNTFKVEGSNQPDYRLVLDVPVDQLPPREEVKTAAAKSTTVKKVVKKVVPVEEVVEEEEQTEEILLD